MTTRKLLSTLIGSLGVALALGAGSAWAIAYRVTDLGVFPATDPQAARTEGTAINASGQVTGSATTTDELHAFLWDGTTLQDLGRPVGAYASVGTAINDSGQVTGFFVATDTDEFRAFLWDGTTMLDLNALIDPALQLTLTVGLDINDRGQILVRGFDSTPEGGLDPVSWTVC